MEHRQIMTWRHVTNTNKSSPSKLFLPTMKILIIDSHKGSLKEPQNLHWLNAKRIKDFLVQCGHEVDLIWSYPTVNDEIKSGYDRIVFNHASHYSYVDYAWLQASPEAKIFHITNEYNLGEPRALWMGVKEGRRYEVIANHEPKISKIVEKYINNWHFVNLNALIFNPQDVVAEQSGCIYYGSYRKGRESSFRKFLQGGVTISTHQKNREKFSAIGVNGPFIDRINWSKDGLSAFYSSLYMEDDVNHSSYNCLANRFYEALNYGVLTLFDRECANTIAKSGYVIPDDCLVGNAQELQLKTSFQMPDLKASCLSTWKEKAAEEVKETLTIIKSIVE